MTNLTTTFSKSEICSLTNIMMHSVQYSRSPSKERALERLALLAEQNGIADDLPALLESQSFKTAQEAAKALHKKMTRPASKKAQKAAEKAEQRAAAATARTKLVESRKVKTNPRINEGYDHVAAERNGDVSEAEAELAAETMMSAEHAIVEIDGTKFKAADLRRGWTKTAKGVYHKTIGDYRFDLNGKTATLTGPKGTATGEAEKFYDACRAAEAAYHAL